MNFSRFQKSPKKPKKSKINKKTHWAGFLLEKNPGFLKPWVRLKRSETLRVKKKTHKSISAKIFSSWSKILMNSI